VCSLWCLLPEQQSCGVAVIFMQRAGVKQHMVTSGCLVVNCPYGSCRSLLLSPTWG
jgi:hypothetical protein